MASTVTARSTKAPPPRRSQMSMRFRICVSVGLRIVFRVEQISQSRAAVRAVAVSVVFLPLGIFGERSVTQSDFAFGWGHLDNLEFHLFADAEPILDIGAIGVL